MGQLCDNGCKVFLTQNDLTVVKGNKIILQGKQNPTDGLWGIPIEKTTIASDNVVLPTTHSALYLKPGNRNNITPRQKMCNPSTRSTTKRAIKPTTVDTMDLEAFRKIILQKQETDNKKIDEYTAASMNKYNHKLAVIIRKKQTHQDLVRYLHAACFSPVQSTWTKATNNNNFVTWPGLTTELVRKHLPLSEATVLGHLHNNNKIYRVQKHDNLHTQNQLKA